MHTINLTQRFLANQPWKNPYGENQSERGEIFIILQQSTGQKTMKNTTYLHRQTLSQSLEISAQQTSRTPFFFSVQKSNANVQQ